MVRFGNIVWGSLVLLLNTGALWASMDSLGIPAQDQPDRSTGSSQNGQRSDPPDSLLQVYGAFAVRGQYGRIPVQGNRQEPGYEWWQAGRLGFWSYRLVLGLDVAIDSGVGVKILLATLEEDTDRDYAPWTNGQEARFQLKEANIRLDRLWQGHLTLLGGRHRIRYPLFTEDDYTGGQLHLTLWPGWTFDWGQWVVFEGGTILGDGEEPADIDLGGPRLGWRASWGQAQLYGLVNSDAGGKEGGLNLKVIGGEAVFGPPRKWQVLLAGVLQRGTASDRHRNPMNWSLQGAAYRLQMTATLAPGVHLTGSWWYGTGDRSETPEVDEGFQQLGYQNTLEKFTFLYRHSLANFWLARLSVIIPLSRGWQGTLTYARVGENEPKHLLASEGDLTLQYKTGPLTIMLRLGIGHPKGNFRAFDLGYNFHPP